MSRDLSTPLHEASLDAGLEAARPVRASTASEPTVDGRDLSRRRAEPSKAEGADRPETSQRRRRWAEVVPAVVGLLLFFAALEVLRIELRRVSWVELMADVVRVPGPKLALAIALTGLNYLVLTGYDFIAFVYIGKTLSRARVMLTSFLSYAIANNVSFAMLSGASVRYRFYSRWGVTGEELSRIVFSYSVTFWLGLFALGGLSLIVIPLPMSEQLPGGRLAFIAGLVLMLIPVLYFAATVFRRAPLRLWKLSLNLPAPPVALAQLALSLVDWALAGAVL